MVQLAPAARVDSQVVVSAKSPRVLTEIPVSAALLLLVRVAVSAGLVEPTSVDGKSSELVDKVVPAWVPEPDRMMVCVDVLPPVLPVKVTAPVRAPVAVGVKFTVSAQLVPAGITAQLPAVEKSPVVFTFDSNRAVVPVFSISNAAPGLVVPSVWLPKTRLAGVVVTLTEPPVPVNVTVSAVAVSGLTTVSVPVRAPEDEGVNVTPMLQLPPAGIEPQLDVAAKSRLAATEVKKIATVPGLLTMTVWAALVVPTGWVPNDRLERFAESVIEAAAAATVAGAETAAA